MRGVALGLTLWLAAAGVALAQQQQQQQGPAQKLAEQGDAALQHGHFAEAEQDFRQALDIREKRFGPDHPATAQSLYDLGRTYRLELRFTDAEPLLQRSLAIREKALGPDNPAIELTLDQLGFVYIAEARIADAEAARRRGLAIAEKSFGPNAPRVARELTELAEILRLEGRFDEAMPLAQRALAIEEQAKGPDAIIDAQTLEVMAMLLQAQGHFKEAQAEAERALEIQQKQNGPDSPAVTPALTTLAQVDIAQGHFLAAEPLFKQALAIREKAFGPDRPATAVSIEDFAVFYRLEGRKGESEALTKRALAIREKVFGPDHPVVATSLTELGFLYASENRYAEAEQLFLRALAIRQKALGPDNRLVGLTQLNLAQLYLRHGDHLDQIDPILKQVLAIDRKTLDPNHPEIAHTLQLLGAFDRDHGKLADAEAPLKEGIAIDEKSLGPDHPQLAYMYDDLAKVYEAENRPADALDASNRSLAILGRHFDSEASESALTDTTGEERYHRGSYFENIKFDEEVAVADPARHDTMVKDTFRTAQLVQSSSAAAALAGMAARFAAGDDALAQVVRQRQDLVDQLGKLDNATIDLMTRPTQGSAAQANVATLRQNFAGASARLAELDQRIGHDFPAYAELSNPQPASVEDIQKLLAPDEAILAYIVGPKLTWLWVVRANAAQLYDIPVGAQQLTNAVRELRQSLDPALNPNFKPFPTTKASALYQQILAPATPLLAGVHHVMVVPDGALESLPLGVLVTQKPAHDPESLADNRTVPWLIRDYAVTVLPAIGSLRALRVFAVKSKATAPFIGVGDPVLQGTSGGTRGTVEIADLFRGGVANVDKVRELPPLPETADELRGVATTLGAPQSALYLEQRASEPLIRQADLQQYRVIEFATHGLMSGEISGLVEPALVLTPPDAATFDNDGLLTASKIARLKLDADWVVLSACNTAASDGTPGADGMSGLAKAFFYAGSRALLVSNWALASKAAVKLTTGTFEALAKDPSIGRAEALRRSELELIDDKSLADAFAHPMIWAPFTLAGEGGAGR